MERNVEQRRLRLKPSRVKTLFVGEMAPAYETFFYNANLNMYVYTQQAFSAVFGEHCGEGEDFLRFFGDKGF